MNINIIIHGDIHYHYKKSNKKELKKEHISKRYVECGKDMLKIKDLIVNGKKEEALKIIDMFQKIQYEVMEWYEEEVSKNIITEEEYLTGVNNFKLVYNKMTELKQKII